MQNRMKQHQLTNEQINTLLERTLTGSLATVSPSGAPYVVPVHFAWDGENVLIHGLPAGEKLSNIKENPEVCFTAYEMSGFLMDDEGRPCETNTEYESVVIKGSAELISEAEVKTAALYKIIEKYTPQLIDREIPQNMLKGTAVIRIVPSAVTVKGRGNGICTMRSVTRRTPC